MVVSKQPRKTLMGDAETGWDAVVNLMKEILGSFLPPLSISLEKTGR
jgi:hypothetical protein